MWDKKTVNGYLVAEGDTKEFAGSDVIASDPIENDLGGRKMLVGFNITTAGTNQDTPLKVQISHDKENWIDADAEVVANVGMATTGVVMAEADLTASKAPWYRLALVPGGSVGTTGRVHFIYTFKPRVIYAEG